VPELHLDPLPTVDAPSVRDFHARWAERGSRAEPVRIRGALDRWPALGRWSPDDFVARFGEVRTRAYAMEKGRIVLDAKTGFRLVDLSFREYVESLAQEPGAPRYYLRAKLGEILPELLREIEIPAYCEGRLALRHNLWFSGEGTITSLHFDLPHNLIAQVFGKKRFLLFPTAESRNLYPEPWISATPHLSRVDPEHPDLARFPRLARARGWEVTLEPGDLLFMPTRLWHHARSVTASISVNFWWAPPLVYPFVRASDLYKRLRGLNI
jgi:hypothetical protein